MLATERLSHVAAVYAQHLIYEVYDVGTHHTDLVDDDEFHLAYDLNFLGVVLQGVADIPHAEHTVVGQQRMEGNLEETVQGASSGIDGSNTGGCKNDVFLFGVGSNVAQKSGLAGACLSCEEE